MHIFNAPYERCMKWNLPSSLKYGIWQQKKNTNIIKDSFTHNNIQHVELALWPQHFEWELSSNNVVVMPKTPWTQFKYEFSMYGLKTCGLIPSKEGTIDEHITHGKRWTSQRLSNVMDPSCMHLCVIYCIHKWY